MYLRKTYSKQTGRTYLSIVQGYRNKEGKSKQKTVQKVGYLDELKKEYDDPVAHFTAVAAAMDKERQAAKSVTITIDMTGQIDRNDANRKNYGYIIFSEIYHELEIDIFLKNARRHENFIFNTDAIMRLLVYTRLLYPGSKRASVLNKKRFFDNFKFSLDDVYDALTHFDKMSGALQQHLHEMVTAHYGRDTDIVYYDVTNYYFEIDRQDDLRKKGPSKEHRKDPIVQMGLLLDKLGLPISYKLFPGNTHDSQTLMPVLTEMKKKFGVRRIITVADKGLNSGDNIAYSTVLGDGYIYSKSVRGASEDFKQWVLDETGYRQLTDSYKLKSKLVPDAEINVTVKQIGKKKIKKKETVEQKWIVFYSEKYAARAKHKREEAIAKAVKMIENPAKYRRTFDYGAAGYIENLKIDKETGEIMNTEDALMLDTRKIEDEEKYDGYYAIVTSELDDADKHIIEMYRGLWRIEESFKVTKSVLGTRPVYLRTNEHINAHFLICFIALLIARIVEMRLGGKYTISKITETLQNVACSHLDQNLWLFDFADEVTDECNAVFGTDFGRKAMTLQEIKKNFGKTKKH
ncbi:Transposase DDE domain-containing protein [Desulfotomaculum arcticum]|uniref:Transposase DDE domain-containing protein n=1 Tax=Desulfotruncus arcticus DSM 17038 TaxID=1121424 RepID=A0A1I2MZ24_9FIRM|nr:IS1634 family transposase [Desulfotruncus arcticus]SFF94717.1 Transposase DDE domain-containing protein [Desulfotomaculum arcticum] [Desulfotruncus arcticus DSM 17038]